MSRAYANGYMAAYKTASDIYRWFGDLELAAIDERAAIAARESTKNLGDWAKDLQRFNAEVEAGINDAREEFHRREG